MVSFFLGGSLPFTDINDIGLTSAKDESGKQNVLNRYGMITDCAGEVKVRFSVARQSGKLAEKGRQMDVQRLNQNVRQQF